MINKYDYIDWWYLDGLTPKQVDESLLLTASIYPGPLGRALFVFSTPRPPVYVFGTRAALLAWKIQDSRETLAGLERILAEAAKDVEVETQTIAALSKLISEESH